VLEHDLELLYQTAWQQADDVERHLLCEVAGVDHDASPRVVFTTIAKAASRIDPQLTAYLWDDLGFKLNDSAVRRRDPPRRGAPCRPGGRR
jgi:hypothetical protein